MKVVIRWYEMVLVVIMLLVMIRMIVRLKWWGYFFLLLILLVKMVIQRSNTFILSYWYRPNEVTRSSTYNVNFSFNHPFIYDHYYGSFRWSLTISLLSKQKLFKRHGEYWPGRFHLTPPHPHSPHPRLKTCSANSASLCLVLREDALYQVLQLFIYTLHFSRRLHVPQSVYLSICLSVYISSLFSFCLPFGMYIVPLCLFLFVLN